MLGVEVDVYMLAVGGGCVYAGGERWMCIQYAGGGRWMCICWG